MSAIYGACGSHVRHADANRDAAAMSAALRHRGPDGDSDHNDPPGEIRLGMRFLRTAPADANPGILINEDRSLAMVCDGHVFNHQELRLYLRERGHVLTTSHSSEILLHLYEGEGIAGWRRADAQFGLAIWDSRARRLVLGRDFLGVRSVYYWHDHHGLIFASEIKALLAHAGVPRAVDEAALSDFLTLTSVPGERTLFRGVAKVPPGAATICEAGGSIRIEPYWDLLRDPIPESGDEHFYIERARTLHEQAVARRDVEGPIGALLSGGNDSSANVALLARTRSRPLHTFTVGLAEVEGHDNYTDIGYARRVAALVGSEHHEYLLTTEEFLGTIPATIDAMDDSVSEPSSVFLYHALRLAKEQQLRAVVTGEANDELSCGHGGMVHIRDGYYRRWLPYLRQPHWIRRALAVLLPLVSPKRRDILRRAADGDEYFWSYETAWMDSDKRSVLAADLAAHAPAAGRVAADCRRRFAASRHSERDFLAYIVYSMMQDFYFSNLMLGKLELLSASLGLEPRCPYTEPAYAHLVFNIPASLKIRNGLVKYFFKRAIEGLLPNEIIYRPKQGFRTPVVELFRGALGTWAKPILLETGLSRLGVLRRDHLESLLRKHRTGEGDYANRLWTAMSLNLWYERWINPPVVDRDGARRVSTAEVTPAH